jgi:hypothetical protein
VGAAAGNGEACIKSRFKSAELNKSGVLLVCFFINGMEEWIMIDDFIPVD